MHKSSYLLMASFCQTYIHLPSTNVLDVGSQDINGTYKDIFKEAASYVGTDIYCGKKNVSVVMKGPYEIPFKDATFDLVISGQALEHVERPWLLCKEMGRVLKPKGLICLIAPNNWKLHRNPLDCWRIFEDGMFVLIEETGCHVVRAEMVGCDTIGIGIKNPDLRAM